MKLESGVPVPPRTRGMKYVERFETMKDGDCRLFEHESDAAEFSIALRAWLKRRNAGNCQMRKMKDGWRVWRNGVEKATLGS